MQAAQKLYNDYLSLVSVNFNLCFKNVEELHPKPKLSVFCALAKEYQNCFEK